MKNKLVSAILIDHENGLTFAEFCHYVEIEDGTVLEMIEQQLIQPIGESSEEWRFDSLCIRRAKTAISFQRDLEINYAGISLALDLMDEIERLQTELNILKKLVE